MNEVIDIRKAAQDIIKERSTQKVKKEKLLSIGLTEGDIQQLFFAERLAKKLAKKERETTEQTQQDVQQIEDVVADVLEQILARYTFGVEIECYNARPEQLVAPATGKGLEMHHEGYNHRDNNRYFKLVSDGSIHGENPIECVSPILDGSNGGFDSLKTCCDTLNEVGAKVNKTTGLHVHIGGDITETQHCNTFVNYFYLENVIDSFMATSRRANNNRFCKGLQNNVDYAQLFNATTCAQIERAFYCDRYYKINAVSWSRHNTIEFRQHQGTTDYEKISNWARFCIRLVNWSETHRLCGYVDSIDEIEFLTDEEKAYFKSRKNALA